MKPLITHAGLENISALYADPSLCFLQLEHNSSLPIMRKKKKSDTFQRLCRHQEWDINNKWSLHKKYNIFQSLQWWQHQYLQVNTYKQTNNQWKQLQQWIIFKIYSLLPCIRIFDTKGKWTVPPPSIHFDVSSLRSYRFCVRRCRNYGKCMEVIVKTGKTNTMTNMWATKTDTDNKVIKKSPEKGCQAINP